MHPGSAKAAFNFVDDVGESQQILRNALQTPLCFNLLGFEATDPGGLFENQPAVLGGRLQQHVHLALFDDAVCLGSHASPGKQIADIAQPGRLPVDQIFTLAAAIDATRNVYFGRFYGQTPVVIVEGQRDLGRVHARRLTSH